MLPVYAGIDHFGHFAGLTAFPIHRILDQGVRVGTKFQNKVHVLWLRPKYVGKNAIPSVLPQRSELLCGRVEGNSMIIAKLAAAALAASAAIGPDVDPHMQQKDVAVELLVSSATDCISKTAGRRSALSQTGPWRPNRRFNLVLHRAGARDD